MGLIALLFTELNSLVIINKNAMNLKSIIVHLFRFSNKFLSKRITGYTHDPENGNGAQQNPTATSVAVYFFICFGFSNKFF